MRLYTGRGTAAKAIALPAGRVAGIYVVMDATLGLVAQRDRVGGDATAP